MALATQPAFTWTVSGGGAMNASGVFTAGSTAGGPFTVTATTNASGKAVVSFTTNQTGTYNFTVTNVVKMPSANYDPCQNVETSDSITIP
jgi:hypothetical protein